MDVEDIHRELEFIGNVIDNEPLDRELESFHRIAVQGIRDNYTSSASPDNIDWLPRKPRRGDDGHPLLIDTGDMLQASTGGGPGHISRVEQGGRSLVVGVDVGTIPYAGAQNFGDESRNLPQREYMGLREERIEECAEVLANGIMDRIG